MTIRCGGRASPAMRENSSSDAGPAEFGRIVGDDRDRHRQQVSQFEVVESQPRRSAPGRSDCP